MKKFLRQIGFLKTKQVHRSSSRSDIGEFSLEKKMEKGVNRAISEYEEVFKKLAQYDRS